MVEYVECQIPVTELKAPKGDGDMQAVLRDCIAPPTRDLNIWLCGRQADLSDVGVAISFWVNR